MVSSSNDSSGSMSYKASGERIIGFRVPVELWQRWRQLDWYQKRVIHTIVLAVLDRGISQVNQFFSINNININIGNINVKIESNKQLSYKTKLSIARKKLTQLQEMVERYMRVSKYIDERARLQKIYVQLQEILEITR